MLIPKGQRWLATGILGKVTYKANWTGNQATSTVTGGNDMAISASYRTPASGNFVRPRNARDLRVSNALRVRRLGKTRRFGLHLQRFTSNFALLLAERKLFRLNGYPKEQKTGWRP